MSTLARFTCEEMFRRLDDFLDRELSEDEMQLAREHLQACAVCAREHAFEAAVLRDVKRKLRRIDIAPSLRERIGRVLAAASGEEAGR